MAHSAFHFAIGLAAGTACLLPDVVRAVRRRQQVAQRLRRWIVLAYVCGIVAIIPSILRRLGLPDAFCSGGWMNVFFLHPCVDRLQSGGMLIAEFAIVACFVAHYTTLLVAILRLNRVRWRGSVPAPGSAARPT